MNLYKLQDSTSNAGSNVNIRSKAKFFSLSKILNKLFHHTKRGGKHIQKHHKKYIGTAGIIGSAHFFLLKALGIKLLGVKTLMFILAFFGLGNNLNTLADFNSELVISGEITITGMNRQTINFENEYQSIPVVLATPVTDNNGDNYPVPTVRNITTTGFELAICVDKGAATCATGINAETINYFVFDRDEADNFSWIEVGTSSVATDGTDTSLTFNSGFSNIPILWTTSQTYNQSGRISAIARIEDANTTTTQTTFIGCVHQEMNIDKCDTGQPDETIGYVAIDLTNQNINTFQNGMNDISNSAWTPISFNPSYIRPRTMITQNDDDGGQDTQYPRARNITTTGGEHRYCEQDAINICHSHTSEKVYWFTIEGYDLSTIPTAEISYNITGNTTSAVIATITNYNKSGINITNNGSSNEHIFTENGSFTFEFEDLAGNTGETTAIVNWIYPEQENPIFIDNISTESINEEIISIDYKGATTKKHKFIDNIDECNNLNTLDYTGSIIITNKDYNNKYFCTYAENEAQSSATSISENKINIFIHITNTGDYIISGNINAGEAIELEEDILELYNDDKTEKLTISGATNLIVSGCNWDGLLLVPTIIPEDSPETADKNEIPNRYIKKNIKAGANNCASLYLSGVGESKYFDIRTKIDNGYVGENIEIFRSSDGTNWEANPTKNTCTLDEELICNFKTEHLTYFSFGTQTGSFIINNDQTHTSGINTILDINVIGAVEMRFGNSTSERDNASWVTYANTFSWIIPTGDGTKTVYAEFSGGGNNNTVEDSIILDTIKPTANIEYTPNLGNYIEGNITATLSGLSETDITITNNGGSNQYIFTGNGSFIFKFKDAAGNTGETIALVNQITPIISNTILSPELNLAYFDNYTLLTNISNSGVINTGHLILKGKNGDGGDCTDYYASGSCISTGDIMSLTFSGGNTRYKSIIRPDNIYPQIGFADDTLYRYNTPEETTINKDHYTLLHFQNNFVMTGNMNFWIEFNTVPQNISRSRDLKIYLVESGHNIHDFNTNWLNSNFVSQVGSISRSTDINHAHTVNSEHHLISLATNDDGTISNSNLDINGDFWIILYSDRNDSRNAGWNLRYQSGTICDDYEGRYMGNLGTQTTIIQNGGCPDAHVHLARKSGYVDGVEATVNITYNTLTGTSTITDSSDFYFGPIPNLAPNSTNFVEPIIDSIYSNNIQIKRNEATDANNDLLYYNIYLLDNTGALFQTIITGESSTGYLLDITGIPDGLYSLKGEICDTEPLCTEFLLEDTFQIAVQSLIATGDTYITGNIITGSYYDIPQNLIKIISSGTIDGYLQISGADSIITSGCNWDGNLIPPTFVVPTAPEAADNSEIPNKDIRQSITAGTNNCASLYLSGEGNSQYFTLKAEILDGSSGDNLEIFRSSDGTDWELNPINNTCTLDENQICTFQTEHLTYFAFGAWTGSFVINNDNTYTSGTNVTLNSSVTGATEMRFGNTTGGRDGASWTGYSTTFPWIITTGDGTKTVYAEFSGGGDSNTVEDTIILDTTKPTASINYNPNTTTTLNVTATLTGLSKSGIIITNNGGAAEYIFTGNGNFTFKFEDLAGNTGEATATVTWINRPIYFTGNTPSDGWSMANQSINIDIGIDVGIFTGFTRSRDGTTYNLYNGGLIFMSNLDNNTSIGDTSTTVIDISNSGNTGTVNGSAIRTGNGKRNGAYTFDGTDDYIDIGTYSLTNFTISTRFYSSQLSNGRRTIIGDPGTSFEVSQNTTNNIELYAQGLISNAIIEANRRYHVAMVKSSAGTELYIDGVLDNSNTDTTSISSPLAIGNGYTNQYWYGGIDEVKIYNYGLSSGDINQLYLSNLQKINSGYWEFNTTQTGLADDTYIYTGTLYTSGNIFNTSRSVTIDQTPFNGSVVLSTDPYDGEENFCIKCDITINFISSMNTGSVTNNLNISPNITGAINTRSGDDTLIITHSGIFLDFNTIYSVTIGTGAGTIDDNHSNEPDIFSFTTNPPQATYFNGSIFEESIQNDGSISTSIFVGLTGDTYYTGINGSNINITNIPEGLTGYIEYISTNKILLTLAGNATNHSDTDDVFGIILQFTGHAFTTLNPENITHLNNVFDVNFLDPYKVILETTKDTALDGDVGYEDYNYGGAANVYLNNLEQILLGFDLSSIPIGATIDSANLSLTMYGGAVTPTIKLRELLNNEWIEGTTVGTTATAGEPTYNQREYGTPGSDWYGGGPGLSEGTDYSTQNLRNTGTLIIDTPVKFDLNNTGLQVLESWVIDSGNNKGFVITVADNTSWSEYLATKEHATPAYHPSLEIFYTPDTTAPTATIEYNPGSGSDTPFDVTTTLTGFSEENIIITNNGGSDTYIFSSNGSFTFEFEDGAGNTGEATATVTWIDKTYPVIQSTDPTNNSNSITTNKTIEIKFNTDMNTGTVESSISINPSLVGTGYTRSDNRTLLISHNDFEFDTNYTIQIDTGAQNISGNNLQSTYIFSFSTIDTLSLYYNIDTFNESLDNNGSIGNNIIITLTGDTFTNDAISGNHIVFTNIPAGLTGTLNKDSNIQITWTLTGTATNHADANDIHNIGIYFDDDAFTNYTSGDIINSSKTDFHIDFLDPYQQLQIIPTDDNTLDADTEPANGCDNGVCQEGNYGALDYGGFSDFGSKVIMKFDLSSITTGSTIYNTDLRITRMDLGSSSTGFEIKQIINNPGWIEGVGTVAGSGVEKALTGESNYKQRKRLEEDWNNGNPGLVELSDYKANNILTGASFLTTGDETKTFDLNSIGVTMIQEWIDTPSSNEGFAIMNADTDWIYIRTSEYATVSERPLLTINYIPDQTSPYIEGHCPSDNENNVSTTTNICIQLNEDIITNTGYNITIKRSIDDSTFQTINITDSIVSIDHNAFTMTVDSNNFESETGYYILIDSGAFEDIAGNTFIGIADTTTWNFTTANTENIPELSTSYYTGVTSTSATLGGTIESIGSGNIIARGIYRSLINGISDGNGTKISQYGNWSSTGDFTVPVSGLSSGTQIYFKAFAVNSFGTGYSSNRGSFITNPDTPTINITDTSNKSFRVNRENITGADNYELYISTDVGFTSLITGYTPMTGIIENTYLVDGLNIQTSYFAKLVAINSYGSSIDSSIVNTVTTFTPTPTVHLKFEESIGSIAYDSVSTHDGILEGNPTKLQTGAENYAYNFDGVDDALSIVDFNYGPELSIYFRIKQNSAIGTGYIFSHGAETDENSINIGFDGNNQQFVTAINGDPGRLTLTGSAYTGLLDNERHLYVLTLDYGTVSGKIESKVYIDGSLAITDSSIDAPLNYNPNTNIVLGRRGQTPTTDTYYSGYIDDFRMYNQYLLESEVETLYLQTLDDTPPTAIVEHNPGSGEQTTSSVLSTLTGFSESGVIITNNLGSNTYTFTENGNFVFEFRDAAGNTGETTATVTRIVTGTLDIGVPSTFTFSGNIRSQSYNQILTGQYTGNNYFYIDDQLGLDRGRYTTISATSLTGDNYANTITNNNLFIKANGIQKLSGDINTGVEINSILLNNYTPLSGQLNYIFRNTATNDLKTGKYGDQPYLKINFPAFKPADNYHGQLIFTIYEN